MEPGEEKWRRLSGFFRWERPEIFSRVVPKSDRLGAPCELDQKTTPKIRGYFDEEEDVVAFCLFAELETDGGADLATDCPAISAHLPLKHNSFHEIAFVLKLLL
ncbi:calcium channel, voltage-dependent, T type, alpha 1G subunit (ISS) [Corchorus olitorius]|uniref:Calcium channel, voltage-dependent, T type, alpha 1G subunit (ISS) n=1 Tax=Corchorus olitorius TaxID=93759 RepID=A0A1R3G7A7_9ROSI|nr:calcium channel, voltage-dependent, T type, alpha 1G subunit (ISS) [Corchorus olitorius]